MAFAEVDRTQTSHGLIVVIDTDIRSLKYGAIAALQFENNAIIGGRTPPDPNYTDSSFGYDDVPAALFAGRAMLADLRRLHWEDNEA